MVPSSHFKLPSTRAVDMPPAMPIYAVGDADMEWSLVCGPWPGEGSGTIQAGVAIISFFVRCVAEPPLPRGDVQRFMCMLAGSVCSERGGAA